MPLIVWVALILVSCAPQGAIYLDLGDHLEKEEKLSAMAVLRLQPFVENFSADEVIGELFIGSDTQLIKIHNKTTSRTLDSLLRQELGKKNIPAASGKDWDLSLEGLAGINRNIHVVMAGRINRLRLTAHKKLVHTKYVLELELESMLGLPKEKKVVTRSVHVSQEMITFKYKQEKMKQLLEDCLADGARQLVEKVDGYLDNKN